ncbi:MAG: deoxyribodipyrimidine photo-lyase [Hyphomonadaceae bacterium]
MQPTIIWFRNDLRLTDNPAIAEGVKTDAPLILLYILEPQTGASRALGGASRVWLHHSLESLATDIKALGGELLLRSGESTDIIPQLIKETNASKVIWNRRYGLNEREADAALKTKLTDGGTDVKTFNGSLLTEPWTLKTGAGGHYRVFTPYWKQVQANYICPDHLPAPTKLETVRAPSESLENWALLPKSPDWATGFADVWTPGENGARTRLSGFLDRPIGNYKDHRNRPDLSEGTSGLSPHLHFGEISPVQIWRASMARMAADPSLEAGGRTFLSEIAWREFSYVLLYHHPDLATENYNKSFEHMPWREDAANYKSWCNGQTGYPIVDAGMRQLWQTGWMHNRVRMIVASFLTKHLLLPWQLGEAWFWDTLVDADPAANAASWQWTAGSGADAAPYFRVFNPITQGAKFDETGDYVRKFCPELAELPLKYLHAPWDADPITLLAAGVSLGETYPSPIVDHKVGRERALEAYALLKQKREAAQSPNG